MIGVFDSGAGGLCSFMRLRELLPKESIIYLADRKNAPYGSKSEKEIASLAESNIRRLASMGARRVLIACCTASGTHPRLGDAERQISYPIVLPAVSDALASTVCRRVAVISTLFTAENHIFKKTAEGIGAECEFIEIPSQMLVGLVELGAREGELFPREEELLDGICQDVRASGADVLILGCTHFSHLRWEFEKRLPGIHITDTARLGAEAFAKALKNEENHSIYKGDSGKDIFIA